MESTGALRRDRGNLRSWLLTRATRRGRDYSFAHGATPTRDQRRAQGARRLRHATRGVGRRVAEDVKKALGSCRRRAPRIELAYFEGYTYIKVAEILNEPEAP